MTIIHFAEESVTSVTRRGLGTVLFYL